MIALNCLIRVGGFIEAAKNEQEAYTMKKYLSLMLVLLCALSFVCAHAEAAYEETTAEAAEGSSYSGIDYENAPRFFWAEAVLSLGLWERVDHSGDSLMARMEDDFCSYSSGEMYDCFFDGYGKGKYAAIVTSAGEDLYLTFIAYYGVDGLTEARTYRMMFNYDMEGSHVFMVLVGDGETLVYKLVR